MVVIFSKRPNKYTQVKTHNHIYTATAGNYNPSPGRIVATTSGSQLPEDMIFRIDVEEDMNEKVSFEKDGESITLKRKQLYELILMIEAEDETLDSITIDRFKELLTAVKL